MEAFDPNENLKNVIREFKRTDAFYATFRHQFIISLFLVIKKYYKDLKLNEEVDQNLRLYADEMISCVETVMYKDHTYPEYRLDEELGIMTRLVVKSPGKNQNVDFIEKTHLAAKELIVRHYPQIIDLSGDGLRLLEKYSRMYSWEFISNFYAIVNKPVNASELSKDKD